MADPDVSGPIDSQLGSYYTRLTMGKYSRPKPFESSKFETTTIINFPIPTELSDNTSVGYNTINLETVGDLINGQRNEEAALMRNSSALIGVGQNFITKVVGAALGKFGGDVAQKLSQGALGGVMGALPPDQISSAIQQLAGVAPNPNASVAFQGPELRSFSYTWVLYPKNDKESANVAEIIKILKQNALPATNSSGASAILNYPSMCQLNFFPWDKKSTGNPWGWSNESIIRYKKCVMSAVNVKYNQFGPPAFFEGTEAPVTVAITIVFKELEYMLSEDWAGKTSTPAVSQPTLQDTDKAILDSKTAQFQIDATHFAAGSPKLTIKQQQDYVASNKLTINFNKTPDSDAALIDTFIALNRK